MRRLHSQQGLTDVLRSHGGVAPLARPRIDNAELSPNQSSVSIARRSNTGTCSRSHLSLALRGRPEARRCSQDASLKSWSAGDKACALRIRKTSVERGLFHAPTARARNCFAIAAHCG